MAKRLFNYALLITVLLVAVYFYHFITFYPHQTAQLRQPLEARLNLLLTHHCQRDSWLTPFSQSLATQYGAYSAQTLFYDLANTSACQFGYQKQFLGDVVSPEHHYRYASVTKWIVSSLIHDAVSEGDIVLTARLMDFFPDVNTLNDVRIGHIQLQHLLDHTAGFDRLSVGDDMFKTNKRPWCPHDVNQLSTLSLSFAPGEKQSYSNVGYCLLGAVLERVYQQPFQQLLEHKLNLKRYNIGFSRDHYLPIEVKYDFRFEEYLNDNYLTHYDFEAVSAPAGLMGSGKALLNLIVNEVAPRWKGYELRHIPNISCDLKKVYGCMQDGAMFYQPDEQGIRLTYHGGYFPGSTSIAILDSYGGITVVLQSGADKPGTSVDEKYQTIYRHLSMHYLLQGKVPAMRRFIPTI